MLLLLLFAVTASASTAGSPTDPLITLSYLDGFASSLTDEFSQVLGNAARDAALELNQLYEQYTGYSFTPSFLQLALSTDDTITLPMGGSFILLSGSGTLSFEHGSVINISTGLEVDAGMPLLLNNRYFCTEDTVATITISASSTGTVDGYYLLNIADPAKQHPQFADIHDKDWYYLAVDYVYSSGLFQGTADFTFSPGASMTRAMFVTVLYRLDAQPAIGSGGQFSDVSNPESYYYNAATWASENSIVLGYDDGTFRPDAPVTREQMATIMHRYWEYSFFDAPITESAFDGFPDRDDISHYALNSMAWAVSFGIINGSGGRLLPRSTASRAQVAQIMYNYITVFG